MPLDFPNSPSLNDTFTTDSGRVWVWDGARWESVGVISSGGDGGSGSITVSETAPGDASEGDLWFNSVDTNTYIYYNDSWIIAISESGSGSISVSATAPENGASGDLWFNSENATTYIYYDGFWVELSEGRDGTDGQSATSDGDQTIIAGQVFG